MRKWHQVFILAGMFFLPQLQAQSRNKTKQQERSVFHVFNTFSQPSLEDWPQVLQQVTGCSNLTGWKIYSSLSDNLGQTHYRVQQYYRGLPVETGVMVLHTANGRILSVNGECIPESDISGSEMISTDAAVSKALQFVPADKYYWQDEAQNQLLRDMSGNQDTSYFPKPFLIYCPQNLDYQLPHKLCYRMDVYAEEPLAGKRVYVDAVSGEVIASEDLVLHTDVKGTAVTRYSGTRDIITDSTAPGNYRLREKARGKGIETYNMRKGTSYGGAVDFTDADNYWNNVNANRDEVATDAHWGAEKTYDFFDSVLGRNSFDNNGAKIISFVHYSNNYVNAFWNGSYMTYGDGNGTSYFPLTSIDVCGHEIAHAVTTYTAGLIYSYESGALNESFSDIFGNAIERWARPNKFNWKMGEDFSSTNSGFRDMSNPNPYNDPQYYKGIKWYSGTGDNGGVHINSGVQNYWFYLITDGVSGTNEVGNAFDIDSLGLIDASRIAYRNLSVYLTKNSNHADARKYSIIAAADLFGNCSKQVIAVTNAWWVCGVGSEYDSGYVKADFIADTIVCSTSTGVRFTNLSDNSLTGKWYFGDGNTSAAFSPVHYYSNYGTYTVKLVAESCFKNKKDSMTKVAYVKVDSTFDICRGVLMPSKGTDSVVQCNGFIYDDGGEGFYGALRQTNLKVQVPGATSIRFRFLDLDYENGYDSIVLFKNTTLQSDKLGRFTGSTLPFGGAWQVVSADALWLRHYSDPLVEGRGFKIEFEGIRPALTLELGNDTTICMGDSLILAPVVSGGYAPDYRYIWNTGHSHIASSIKVAPVIQTKYKLTLQDVCTSNSLDDSITVSVRAPLSVALSKDTVICEGNPVQLSAKASGGLSSAYTYTWTPALSNAPVQNVTPAGTTTYRVVLSDGCTEKNDSAWQTVIVKPALQISLSATDTLVCIGKPVTLTAQGSGGDTAGYNFTWNQGLGTGAVKNLNLTDTGVYTVTLSDGCSVTKAVQSITLYTHPTLDLSLSSDTLICRGSGVDLLATGSGGRGSGYTYTWSHGKSAAAITEFPANPSFFKVALNDGCSPAISDSVFIDFLAPLSITRLRDTTLCDGQTWSPSLSVSGGLVSAHSVVWVPGTVSGLNPFLNPPTGKTNYRAVLSDGCTVRNDTTAFSVTKLAPLSAILTVSPTSICLGDSVGLSFSFSGGKSSAYTWTLDNLSVSFMTVKKLPMVNTTYTLKLSDGCSIDNIATGAVSISPAAFATLTSNQSVVCDGAPVDFSYTSPDAAFLRWHFSDGDSADGTGTTVQHSFSPAGNYTVSARVITSQGCSGTFNLAPNVDVVAYPSAAFTAVPPVTDIEHPDVVFTDGSSGGTDYFWSFGDGSQSFIGGNQNHTYLDTGLFRVELKLSVAPGCRDSVVQMVRIKDVYRLLLPSAFTPDANNLNDIYLARGRGIKTFHIVIYNRWGMKVFESDDMSKGWDGMAPGGTPWEPGIYPVLVEVIDTENFRHVEKGTIYLSR